MFRSLALLVLLISMLLVACDGDKDKDSSDDTIDGTQQDAQTETPDTNPPTSENPTLETETVWVVKSEQPVDVYSCPETTCDSVGLLFPGMTLDVVSTEDEWHEIELEDGATAYIEVSLTEQVTRLRPPDDSSLPPGVTPSDSTSEALAPPSDLTGPPGQPTFDGTITAPEDDGPPSDMSAPPGQPTFDGTIVPNLDSDGPPNVTSEPPPGVN
jgi:hypothetical protein